MSMSVRTPYYDFAPYEVNRVGRVAPEQRYRYISGIWANAFVLPVIWLVPLFVALPYVFKLSGRWHVSTYPLDNWVQDLDALLLVALGIVGLIGGLRAMVVQRLRRRELAEGRLVQGTGYLRWRAGYRNNEYVAEIGGRSLCFPFTSLRSLIPGPYRFFYLPHTRMLIAAEPIGGVPPHFDLLQRLAETCGFTFGDLAANRAGQISPEQASRHSPRTAVPILLVFFGMLMLAFIFLLARGPEIGADYVLAMLDVGLILTLGTVYVVQRTSPRRPVAMSEGTVRKVTYEVDYVPTHFFEIDGRQFRVPEAAYDVLDESLRYRVYYLPRGNRLLSMEPLASETAALAV